jgi:hypothetical protein
MAGGNPDPYTRGNRDDCKARRAAVSNDAGAVAPMTTRTQAENSTVIATGSTGMALSSADGDGGNRTLHR